MQITGAKNPQAMEVSSDNRGDVSSRSAARIYYNARDLGQAYSWGNLDYDYDALDTILLVKNTHADQVLHIHKIFVSGNAATEVIIFRTTAEITPVGTAVVGTNLSGVSSNVAKAVAKADETANSGGALLLTLRIAANSFNEISLNDVVGIGPTQAIGVDLVTNGASCSVTILGYFEADK